MTNRSFYPPSPSDMLHTDGPYQDVHRERIRAHNKHDSNGGSMERRTYDDPEWLPVLVEEVGEVAKVLCDFRHRVATDTMHSSEQLAVWLKANLRKELVQVAAMAIAWIDSIDLTIED